MILPCYRFASALFCNNLCLCSCVIFYHMVKIGSETSCVEARACLPMQSSGHAGKFCCMGHSTAAFERQCHTDRTLVRAWRRLGSAGYIVLIESSHLRRFGSRSRTCALPASAAATGWSSKTAPGRFPANMVRPHSVLKMSNV